MDESNKGVGNTTNQTNEEGQNVFFDSYNIGRKEKTKYFPGEAGEKPKPKGLAVLFEGKNKFITIAAIAAVFILLVLLALWLTVWRKDKPEVVAQPTTVTEVSQNSITMDEVIGDAFQIYDADKNTDTPYESVLAYLEEKATDPKNAEISFEIRMVMSTLYLQNKEYQADIDYLLNLDTNYIEDTSKARMYRDLAQAYEGLGDTERAGYYTEQSNYLVAELGGGDDEDE